ncbi:MAG: amidotransferase 1, exosortase A system-associated [Gammaproteobacteria bacterium]|nr:amidotransferase 1, exosortase A system-associated [Gammaproteobacteria bacterium]
MCGIAGIVDLRGQRDVDRALLARMCDAIAHRGPDAGDYHFGAGVGLGHRRLSIIDLAGGKQPMYNEDRTVVVTYNGEIYNFQPLREELAVAGHRFQTHSDTEVLVHGWEQWQEDSVTRFNGMFAYALWDENRQCLFLARDRLGIKPLYYSVLDSGFLIFASELKALLLHPQLQRDLDPRAVEQYMTLGYVAEPFSILTSVQKLEPGHCIRFTRGQSNAEARQFWNIPAVQEYDLGEEDLSSQLLGQLKTAVQRRMIADVPLGAFLSGGVDSSAVVATMSELSSTPVKTCSIAFADESHDESRYARQVAEQFATEHYSHQVEADDFALIDTLAGVYDEPYADSSAIPTYRVCAMARRHVKVALSGDGADELLAGYRRYRMHTNEEKLRNAMPAALRSAVFGPLSKIYPKLDWAPRFLRARTTLAALSTDPVSAYLDTVSRSGQKERQALYNDEFRSRLQGYRTLDLFRQHAAESPVSEGLGLVQYLDFKSWLPGDILTKVDRASMAHGLEVRVPFLDHEFVEWAAGIADRHKIHAGTGKYLLKKALEDKFSKQFLYREKMGFSVPLSNWLRGPARAAARERLSDVRLGRFGVFDSGQVGRMLDQHESGRADHSTTLWSLIMFEASAGKLLDLS